MRLVLVLVALCVANLVYADDANCAHAVTQTDLNLCTYAAASAEQKELDALLADLKQSLSPKNWKILRQSQVLWKKTRKLDCEIVESFFAGGSIRPTIVNGCYGAHTHDRIQRLKYYLCPSYSMTDTCKAAAKYD